MQGAVTLWCVLSGCSFLNGSKDEVEDASESFDDVADVSVDSESDPQLVSSSLYELEESLEPVHMDMSSWSPCL